MNHLIVFLLFFVSFVPLSLRAAALTKSSPSSLFRERQSSISSDGDDCDEKFSEVSLHSLTSSRPGTPESVEEVKFDCKWYCLCFPKRAKQSQNLISSPSSKRNEREKINKDKN